MTGTSIAIEQCEMYVCVQCEVPRVARVSSAARRGIRLKKCEMKEERPIPRPNEKKYSTSSKSM